MSGFSRDETWDLALRLDAAIEARVRRARGAAVTLDAFAEQLREDVRRTLLTFERASVSTIFVPATVAGYRTSVRIDGRDVFLPLEPFLAVLRLLAARVRPGGWVPLVELAPHEASGWKTAARIREVLRPALGGQDPLENGRKQYRLAPCLQFAGAAWEALEGHPDELVRDLAPAVLEAFNRTGTPHPVAARAFQLTAIHVAVAEPVESPGTSSPRNKPRRGLPSEIKRTRGRTVRPRWEAPVARRVATRSER